MLLCLIKSNNYNVNNNQNQYDFCVLDWWPSYFTHAQHPYIDQAKLNPLSTCASKKNSGLDQQMFKTILLTMAATLDIVNCILGSMIIA